MPEKFSGLPIKKQNIIIDAALAVFSENGYKKTSVNDIAVKSGISKSLVFHYFGTKKALYLYLIEVCSLTFKREMHEKFDTGLMDFFDRVLLATAIEISILKKHPAILAFLKSIYFETDAEVKEDVQAMITSDEGENFRRKLTLESMDASKFKEDVDPELVLKMFTRIGYGYMNMSPLNTERDLDAVYRDFENCIYMLRNNLYKMK